MKDQIADLIRTALNTLIDNGLLPSEIEPRITIDRTKDKSHGDLASNIAMTLAKAAKRPPRDIAQAIIEALPANDAIAKAEIAGPGFINFFLDEATASAVISNILEQGQNFGRNNNGQGRKVQVEYVSANPTGPLHVGHGRGAVVGPGPTVRTGHALGRPRQERRDPPGYRTGRSARRHALVYEAVGWQALRPGL